ncbi:RNA polymerase sporulation-specific sigma factor, partial [Thermosyntropha lipolytica DSM 11003]
MSTLSLVLGLLALIKGGILLFGYLTSQVFPRPLTEEEERDYLRCFKNGDEEARDRLIEHNLRLVAHVVRKYENSGEDMEDLISIGAIGLIKAISTFDEDKGVRLATYA